MHQRLKECGKTQLRIFGEVSNRINGARERYRWPKQIRRDISAANLYEGEDTRFYAKILLNGLELEGLLDSGATVTCLGKDCIELAEKTGPCKGETYF